MGTCEFVVCSAPPRESNWREEGARYVWHKMLVGTVPEKKKYVEGKRFPGADFGNKKKFSIRVMVRGRLFFNKTALAVMSMEDTALKTVAPRMSCAVLAAAAW